jgi:aldehyde:ferredoxin oxidoreductase
MNRILRVDLTRRTFREEALDPQVLSQFIGGRGLGVRLLYEDLKPGIDPLGEENEIIFIAGPLAGTAAQSLNRWKAFFKSPLTGGYFKSSGGGHFGSEMKAAGLDAIILRGVSEHPVYLWLHDGRCEFRDASYLWGLDCDDTHTLIREELHDPAVRVACIGPAGENLVKFAGIFSDRRTAGRGGGGAVMGAKNLKAVAVRGRGKVPLADPEGFEAAVKEQVERIRTDPHFAGFSQHGSQNPEFTNILGMFPTRNFREGVLPHWERIESSEYDKLRVRKERCHNCMIHCSSITKVSSGRYKGTWSEGPEYETAWAFSGPIACADIGLTVAADKLCDDLGLDTISAGVSIGFAYELFEKGLITKQDTGGLELTYGNDVPVLTLLRQIAFRQGLGDLLAEGTAEASRRLGRGSERFAIHCKGLELPGYDPRGAKAHGLNLMTTSIGADHNSGYGVQEIFGAPFKGQPVDRFAVQGKAEITKWNQDLTALWDTGILCSFAGVLFMTPELFGKLLRSATGIKTLGDPKALLQVGERISNLERMFNVREGFGRKDDAFPERFTKEKMPSGPARGQVFEAEALVSDYYRVRGWDRDTGVPTEATLSELGLRSIVR